MTVRVTRNTLKYSIEKMVPKLKDLPEDAYDVWVKNTPKKTGNARRKTTLRGERIRADYNYAVPLDNGHSKQSPKGMSKPTEEYIQKRLKQIIRK